MTDEVAPKKKRVNSKGKGNGYENATCKILAAALPPMQFRRSQSSGAILGGKNAKMLDNFSLEAKTLFIGDVCPTNEADVQRDHGWKFKFTVECKFYKDVETLEHLFANTKIIPWFEQAQTDADKLQKQAILIFKFNRTETFVAVNADTIDRLPSKISRSMTFEYNDSHDVARRLKIFLLKEAIVDTDWWKVL
jgi:hypothetical protein